MDTSDLAKRMKKYEFVPKSVLMTRTPVIIRLDMKAGHTFTRGFQRPFDAIFIESMQYAMKYLCENIQGCVLGYSQSDEISLVLVDYKTLDTSAWFDYEVQKMCSVSASMATMAFNKCFQSLVEAYQQDYYEAWHHSKEEDKYMESLILAVDRGAMFDARVFNIPKEEVTNCVYWRQLDATRNSIQMVGQANFSHKELQDKSCNDIQDMLMTQKGINWNDLPTHQKRGSCCIREFYEIDSVMRTHWVIDTEIPIFKNEGREYIEKLINFK